MRVRVRACGWGKDPLLGRPMLSLAKVGQVAIFPIAVTKVSFNLSLLHGGVQDVVRCLLQFGLRRVRFSLVPHCALTDFFLNAGLLAASLWLAMARFRPWLAMASLWPAMAGHDHPFIGQLLVGHG